jgi:DNA helicase-2/ATP-dependent DNA helicase PcrA
MSDLVEGGAGFKTEILKTNYRSGELIVQAANRLIAHNTKQIPMTCEANPKRADKGGIVSVPFPPQEPKDMTAPAQWLAARVEEMMELGQAGKKGYDAFGVGLRSNAEAYTYGLELLKKGIPFRAKANFFGDNNTKALLHWLTIADEGMNGDVTRINDAVLNARSAPTSMLGQKFVDELTQRASGNYLMWLQQNYASIYGPRAFQTASVKAYVDNLTTVANLKDSGLSNEMLLDAILGLQGTDGSTVKDALVDKVRDDDELMAELRAANPKGEVDEDAVQEQAMAPIAPLKGLLDARANLTEAMKYVRTLQTANAKLTANDDPEAKGFKEPAVTLGTMHSWKGLEVENMFVPVVGGKFPRTDASDSDLASERRLAYVALTRGENNVFVLDIPTIRRTKNGEVVLKSRFMDEMCLPVSAPATTGGRTASTSKVALLPNGRSPFDPEVMDAYLRGEDPSLLPSVGGPSMTGPLWNDTLYTGE